MNMKDGQGHPILSCGGISVLEKKKEVDGARGTGDRKRNKRTERQMDSNMIYPDLGSCLRTMKGGTGERWQ